jgi:hypothetical protein
MTPVTNARRDLFEAMKQIAETGRGPKEAIHGVFDQVEALSASAAWSEVVSAQ